jgi:Tfp pilus assembly protein PilN
MFFHERSIVQQRRTTLAEVNQRVAAAEATVAAGRASQALAQSRLAAASGLTSQRVVWEKVLRDLSRVLPGNVWLQTLGVQAPVAAVNPAAGVVPTDTTASTTTNGLAPAPAPVPVAPVTTFTVTGFTGSQRGVALLLDRLALLPWLSDVTLTSSQRGGAASSDAAGSSATPVQFTIGATLSSTGGK